jgi:hypothetical protein
LAPMRDRLGDRTAGTASASCSGSLSVRSDFKGHRDLTICSCPQGDGTEKRSNGYLQSGGRSSGGPVQGPGPPSVVVVVGSVVVVVGSVVVVVGSVVVVVGSVVVVVVVAGTVVVVVVGGRVVVVVGGRVVVVLGGRLVVVIGGRVVVVEAIAPLVVVVTAGVTLEVTVVVAGVVEVGADVVDGGMVVVLVGSSITGDTTAGRVARDVDVVDDPSIPLAESIATGSKAASVSPLRAATAPDTTKTVKASIAKTAGIRREGGSW